MSSTTSNLNGRANTYWWNGGLMEIKARAADTGGALGALEGRFFEQGYGPPLHVHSREDEIAYVLGGEIRFRRGDEEFVAGPGTWVWHPRGVPHSFKVESDGARALFLFTPGGLEQMFEDGGAPAAHASEPSAQPDVETAIALAKQYAFEVVGPQVA
jgi:quercetin dioxygenase-like cupin family protein